MMLFRKVIWQPSVLTLDSSTCSPEFRSIMISEDVVKLQIWDTAGQ